MGDNEFHESLQAQPDSINAFPSRNAILMKIKRLREAIEVAMSTWNRMMFNNVSSDHFGELEATISDLRNTEAKLSAILARYSESDQTETGPDSISEGIASVGEEPANAEALQVDCAKVDSTGSPIVTSGLLMNSDVGHPGTSEQERSSRNLSSSYFTGIEDSTCTVDSTENNAVSVGERKLRQLRQDVQSSNEIQAGENRTESHEVFCDRLKCLFEIVGSPTEKYLTLLAALRLVFSQDEASELATELFNMKRAISVSSSSDNSTGRHKHEHTNQIQNMNIGINAGREVPHPEGSLVGNSSGGDTADRDVDPHFGGPDILMSHLRLLVNEMGDSNSAVPDSEGAVGVTVGSQGDGAGAASQFAHSNAASSSRPRTTADNRSSSLTRGRSDAGDTWEGLSTASTSLLNEMLKQQSTTNNVANRSNQDSVGAMYSKLGKWFGQTNADENRENPLQNARMSEEREYMGRTSETGSPANTNRRLQPALQPSGRSVQLHKFGNPRRGVDIKNSSKSASEKYAADVLRLERENEFFRNTNIPASTINELLKLKNTTSQLREGVAANGMRVIDASLRHDPSELYIPGRDNLPGPSHNHGHNLSGMGSFEAGSFRGSPNSRSKQVHMPSSNAMRGRNIVRDSRLKSHCFEIPGAMFPMEVPRMRDDYTSNNNCSINSLEREVGEIQSTSQFILAKLSRLETEMAELRSRNLELERAVYERDVNSRSVHPRSANLFPRLVNNSWQDIGHNEGWQMGCDESHVERDLNELFGSASSTGQPMHRETGNLACHSSHRNSLTNLMDSLPNNGYWTSGDNTYNSPSYKQFARLRGTSGSTDSVPLAPELHDPHQGSSNQGPSYRSYNTSRNQPADNGILNNQVPPGVRANNYWDNFRSYSRQNMLSSPKSNSSLNAANGNALEQRLPLPEESSSSSFNVGSANKPQSADGHSSSSGKGLGANLQGKLFMGRHFVENIGAKNQNQEYADTDENEEERDNSDDEQQDN